MLAAGALPAPALSMLALEAVHRAQSAMTHRAVYRLGMGGFNPSSPVPWNSRGECDCSGFVAWCLGVGRHLDHPWYAAYNGGWLETTAIVRDAVSRFGFFDRVAAELAKPGDLLVYGDHDGHQGHVGLVATAQIGVRSVIHCSLGAFKNGGDAIAESSPGLWLSRGGIVARYALFTEP